MDHRGADVLVTLQLLNGADVVTGLEQMGGERMAECMARRRFGDARRAHRLLHRPLQHFLVEVMAPLLPGISINGAMTGRKDILPAPLAAGIRVFSRATRPHQNRPLDRPRGSP